MVLTLAICSSVVPIIRPVLKQACSSEKNRSHLFMKCAIQNASGLSRCRQNGDTSVLVKCATAGCGMCGARIRHPAIPSQRALASSVGKTPSFSFCQVPNSISGVGTYAMLSG